MDRAERRRRIAQHPNAVRFDELRRMLEAYGWEVARVRGSHHVFARGGTQLAVPFRRPTVLPVYVKRALRFTEEQDDDD